MWLWPVKIPFLKLSYVDLCDTTGYGMLKLSRRVLAQEQDVAGIAILMARVSCRLSQSSYEPYIEPNLYEILRIRFAIKSGGMPV